MTMKVFHLLDGDLVFGEIRARRQLRADLAAGEGDAIDFAR
jgi:hypothetical protein